MGVRAHRVQVLRAKGHCTTGIQRLLALGGLALAINASLKL
jgi:hypothetical protein